MHRRLPIFISLLSLLLIAGAVFAQPKLTVPIDNFNFGYTPQNAKVSCGFWLYSTGRDTLKITNVKTGCGCTKAPLEKDILPPGDSTRLEIIFSTKRYQHEVSKTTRLMTNSGEVTNKVTITSNILLRPDSTYPVTISPYKLNISQLGEKKRDEIKFTLENISPVELEPRIVTFPESVFEVTLPDKIKPGEKAVGKVKLKTKGLESSFQESFTLELNDPNQTRFTVPVVRNYRQVSSTR